MDGLKELDHPEEVFGRFTGITSCCGAVAALHNLQLAFATQQRYFYEMEVELCKYTGKNPDKALKELYFWTKARNSLAYRELKARQGKRNVPTARK